MLGEPVETEGDFETDTGLGTDGGFDFNGLEVNFCLGDGVVGANA